MGQNFEGTEAQLNVTMNRCPGCGAQLKYDIETGVLKCRHCNTAQEIETDDSTWRRELTNEIMHGRTQRKEGKVARCESCGSSEVLDRTSINKICNFCGSTSILDTNDLCGIEPDSIIPFTVDTNRAHKSFEKWIKGRRFAPGIFKQTDVRENVSPIYIPSWSFSADSKGHYSGQLGRRVQQTIRQANGQIRTQTRIRLFRVAGHVDKTYTDYLVPSGKSISPINFNSLRPFAMDGARPYRQEFLAGISTEHYSKEVGECFKIFTDNIRQDLRQDIMRKYRADTVQTLTLNLEFNRKRFNYLLLPLYVANYKYKDKTYNFYINGTSGKIVGKYPISRTKISLLVMSVIAAAAIAFAVWWFFL